MFLLVLIQFGFVFGAQLTFNRDKKPQLSLRTTRYSLYSSVAVLTFMVIQGR